MGVNLLYGAFYHSQPEKLISSLQENIAPGRFEVDMIKFSGPAFARIDNRLMSLQLVSQGLTNAVMFSADGETAQPTEVFYKKRFWWSAAASVPSPTRRTTCWMVPDAKFSRSPVHRKRISLC